MQLWSYKSIPAGSQFHSTLYISMIKQSME